MRRPWTHAEEEALRVLGPQVGGPACAAALDRSIEAVRTRAKRIGVRLRRRKTFAPILTRCGPESVLRRIRELIDADVCPSCGLRPIGVRRTGLCGRCHFDGLRLVHDEEIAKADGQLALYASRSKLYRRRRELAELTGAETGDGRATMDAEDSDRPQVRKVKP